MQIFRYAEAGSIKLLWISATNPAVSRPEHHRGREMHPKPGRVVVVHEAPRTCGFGAELISVIIEKAFLNLQAPPVRVTGFDTPFPYTLEHEYLPDAGRIREAVQNVMSY